MDKMQLKDDNDFIQDDEKVEDMIMLEHKVPPPIREFY